MAEEDVTTEGPKEPSEEPKEAAKVCRLCQIASKGTVPGTVFFFLEGEPFVCDRCIARFYGVEASWKEEIEKDFVSKTA